VLADTPFSQRSGNIRTGGSPSSAGSGDGADEDRMPPSPFSAAMADASPLPHRNQHPWDAPPAAGGALIGASHGPAPGGMHPPQPLHSNPVGFAGQDHDDGQHFDSSKRHSVGGNHPASGLPPRAESGGVAAHHQRAWHDHHARRRHTIGGGALSAEEASDGVVTGVVLPPPTPANSAGIASLPQDRYEQGGLQPWATAPVGAAGMGLPFRIRIDKDGGVTIDGLGSRAEHTPAAGDASAVAPQTSPQGDATESPAVQPVEPGVPTQAEPAVRDTTRRLSFDAPQARPVRVETGSDGSLTVGSGGRRTKIRLSAGGLLEITSETAEDAAAPKPEDAVVDAPGAEQDDASSHASEEEEVLLESAVSPSASDFANVGQPSPIQSPKQEANTERQHSNDDDADADDDASLSWRVDDTEEVLSPAERRQASSSSLHQSPGARAGSRAEASEDVPSAGASASLVKRPIREPMRADQRHPTPPSGQLSTPHRHPTPPSGQLSTPHRVAAASAPSLPRPADPPQQPGQSRRDRSRVTARKASESTRSAPTAIALPFSAATPAASVHGSGRAHASTDNLPVPRRARQYSPQTAHSARMSLARASRQSPAQPAAAATRRLDAGSLDRPVSRGKPRRRKPPTLDGAPMIEVAEPAWTAVSQVK
jgi:hypothetical protein